MNCKLLLSIASLIGVASAAGCWAEDLGYDCCKGCDVYYTDSDGDWGVENNQWCGILDEKCKTPVPEKPAVEEKPVNNQPTTPTGTNDVFNPTNDLATSPITDTRKRKGRTTRYWDCCKPSCAWNYKANVTHEVYSCLKDGSHAPIAWTTSGCAVGGEAFMCNDQQPWEINDKLSYGFAAANISGSDEEHWCCACFKITFTSTSIAGKQMIVQITNTGGDLGENHFDIQMPGGGLGLFDGCSPQFSTDAKKWGNQYGGLTSESQCALLPEVLQPGCHWRYGWFEDADNPEMEFEEVQCPQELVDITGCARLA